MKVTIVGAGYVGLVTGACLAEHGHEVVCVDRDAERVRAIESGRAPFHEPGLDALLARQVGGRLRATSDLADAVASADVTMIATGTPFDGKQIDLSYVTTAAREIGRAMRRVEGYSVVVVKSTVVPGTTEGVVREALEEASGKRAGVDFGLGMNPEFLSEGTAVADFERPDRIVVGGVDERTCDVLAELYREFEGVPLLRTTNATAELIKYASNALLATMISFSNEIASLAELLPGVDAMEVMRGVHAMRELVVEAGGRRTADLTRFLSPGCGFGGSCLPKDVSALSAWGAAKARATPLLDAVMQVNRARPSAVVAMLERELGVLDGKRVAVLGLAFKPDTDDVRESPAFPIVERLLARGASVRAYDPVANPNAARVLGPRADVLADSVDQALAEVDAVVLVTPWAELREATARLGASGEAAPVVLDTRRALEPDAYPRYLGVGLGTRAAGARELRRLERALPAGRLPPRPFGGRDRAKGGGS